MENGKPLNIHFVLEAFFTKEETENVLKDFCEHYFKDLLSKRRQVLYDTIRFKIEKILKSDGGKRDIDKYENFFKLVCRPFSDSLQLYRSKKGSFYAAGEEIKIHDLGSTQTSGNPA